MGSKTALRPATPADEWFVRALFADEMQQFSLLGPDVRELLLDMEFRGRRSEVLAQHPDAQCWIITANGTDVGYLVYDASVGVTKILEVVVGRSHRRLGIGAAALEHVPSGPKAATVRARNRAARSLYTRLGFIVAEETRTQVTLACA